MSADAALGGEAAIGSGTELVPTEAADWYVPPVEVDAPVLCATDGSETNGVLSLACTDMRVIGIRIVMLRIWF